MKKPKITIEHLLYLLAFIIALTIRLLALGEQPLNDLEAQWALQAMKVAGGDSSGLGPQPLYILLTSSLFFVFESSNFLARFIPALAGSFLVLAPFLFRRPLGRAAAILVSFGLALDPGMVASSRLADGHMLALVSFVLAAGFIFERNAAVAGIFAAMALLAGPSIWGGLLGLALAVAWTWLNHRRKSPQAESWWKEWVPAKTEESMEWKKFLAWGAGALITVGTLFFMAPNGISALFSSIAAYIRGWGLPPETDLFSFLIILCVYECFLLIFGIWGAVGIFRRDNNRMENFLVQWFLAALLVAIINPARLYTDLIWPLFPLWLLAARQISQVFDPMHFVLPIEPIQLEDRSKSSGEHPPAAGRLPYIGQGILVFSLLSFSLLNLRGLSQALPGDSSISLRWAGVGGAILLLVLISMLIGWGWSRRVAVDGFVLGVFSTLLIYSLSASWNAAGLGPAPGAELWLPSAAIQEADILLDTIGDVSEWNTAGGRDFLDLQVIDVSSPALDWALRDLENSVKVSYAPVGSTPSMTITREETLSLTAAYTGQDFVWQAKPAWKQFNLRDWSRWLFYRQAVYEQRELILWVRTDYFPGAVSSDAP